MTNDDLERIYNTAYANEPRSTILIERHLAGLRAVLKTTASDCVSAIDARRKYWYDQADVYGERRDWDATNRHEAMAEAAAFLMGTISRRHGLVDEPADPTPPAAGGEK